VTDGADTPVEGEPTALPPPEAVPAETASAAAEPLTPSRPPRVGSVVVHDRHRVVLGVATAVALAVASVFGFRLLRLLTDASDEPSPPVEGPVGELVPFVVALAEPPSSPGAPEVLAALNGGRHDIAVDTDVSALCATVALDEDVSLAGWWELNGETVASTSTSDLTAPGFADCVTADGEALPDGTYQFVVADDDAVSAPGTVVLGAAAVAQQFLNETDEPLCQLRLAPLQADFFDVFDTSAAPIEPDGSITLALADVRYRLEAVACDGGDVVSRRQIRPDASAVRTI